MAAASHFIVGISTVINRVQRFGETGIVYMVGSVSAHLAVSASLQHCRIAIGYLAHDEITPP
jgi:transposase